MPTATRLPNLARYLVTTVLALVVCAAASAQSGGQYDKGTPPQHMSGVSAAGSHTGADLGTINLANGSLNFKLPLGSVGGRGFSLPLTLNYGSKVWSAWWVRWFST